MKEFREYLCTAESEHYQGAWITKGAPDRAKCDAYVLGVRCEGSLRRIGKGSRGPRTREDVRS